MTENKSVMDKKQMKFEKNNVSLQKKKEKRMKSKKLKQLMKKRLIIRNLSFKISEEELEKIFSEFGEVLDVNIPVNNAGRKRGFAFVRYKDSKAQIKAMKALNFKEIHGRPIALDFAVDKTTYQSQLKNKKCLSESLKDELKESRSDSDVDSEDEDIKPEVDIKVGKDCESDDESEDDDKVMMFMKEFNADKEPQESLDSETNNESSYDSDIEENESHVSGEEDDCMEQKQPIKKKLQSNDVSEGKTVFIRNVPYKSTEEDLQEVMEEYGETVYCLLCTDPFTDHPKGTAFVKFKEKESADKVVEESAKEPGIILDGRKLVCAYAISREELSKKLDGSEKVKDKRNLRLLKCGLIMHGSEESEGVSQTDMAKRAQLEMIKKKKLKNVNFFVSDKRLAVHNLPKNVNDKDLRILFKKAAGKGAVIKEARVMKDLKKTNSQGIPVSRGFGFVSFTEHEHALQAVKELNNNPNIFAPTKRPIVEFSVENKVALLSQERKREKLKMLHKKKLEERSINSQQMQENSNQKDAQPSVKHLKRKKKGNKANNSNSRKKQNIGNNQLPDGTQGKTPKKKQKKVQKNNKKRNGNTMNDQEKKSFSILKNKYKEKLLNKF